MMIDVQSNESHLYTSNVSNVDKIILYGRLTRKLQNAILGRKIVHKLLHYRTPEQDDKICLGFLILTDEHSNFLVT